VQPRGNAIRSGLPREAAVGNVNNVLTLDSIMLRGGFKKRCV